VRVVRGCFLLLGVVLVLLALPVIGWGAALVNDWNVPTFDSSDEPGGTAGLVLIGIGLVVGAVGIGSMLVSRTPPDERRERADGE
jgi:hypothetical protein